MDKTNVKTGNYIIIGGANNKFVEWGERQELGLSTGYKVYDVALNGVIVEHTIYQFIPFCNVHEVFNDKKQYDNWLMCE